MLLETGLSISGRMVVLPRSGRGLRHHANLFFPVLLASAFGYIVYNTGLVLGFVKPSSIGLIQCAQSFGTIGCPDTVNGLLYVVLGAVFVYGIFHFTGFQFRRRN